MANKLFDDTRWRGRKNGDYIIKNITSRINKDGNREFYVMLDYSNSWIKISIDKNLNSYIRVNGQRLYMKDFVYENVFNIIENKE